MFLSLEACEMRMMVLPPRWAMVGVRDQRASNMVGVYFNGEFFLPLSLEH